MCPARPKHRRRVLFIAEAVTLAHVGRPLYLASALNQELFEVVFASDSRYQQFYRAGNGWQFRSVFCIAGERFRAALNRGQPVYDASTLNRYVEDDLALIDETKPDIIVGDFRLSLSVSARVAKRPYITVTNAYWSPFAKRELPLPVLPIVRALGLPAARAMFKLLGPLAMKYHAAPLNSVRRRYGLASLGADLRNTYTDADVTLYADVPELIPTSNLPPNHHYIGPVLWSPPIAPPHWWGSLPKEQPVIYVTMGSSGTQENLSVALEGLVDMDCAVVVATASMTQPTVKSNRLYITDYLPGLEASRRAKLVICNGGSPTTHQAFAAGVPVLGIGRNMDQFLNMDAVSRFGAGLLVRADRATPASIHEAAAQLLSDPSYGIAARKLQRVFSQYQTDKRFSQVLAQLA